MNFSEQSLKYAALHSSIFVPGDIGTVGPTLEMGSPTSKVTKLTLMNNFVFAEVRGPKGSTAQVLIPITNVTHVVPK